MAKINVYSKFPIAVQFENPNNGHNVIIYGVNSHKLEFNGSLNLHTQIVENHVPFTNEIDEEDWAYFKEKYGNRTAYFDKLNGDCFFTAKDIKEATIKSKDTKDMVDDKFVVSKQTNIKQTKKGDE